MQRKRTVIIDPCLETFHEIIIREIRTRRKSAPRFFCAYTKGGHGYAIPRVGYTKAKNLVPGNVFRNIGDDLEPIAFVEHRLAP